MQTYIYKHGVTNIFDFPFMKHYSTVGAAIEDGLKSPILDSIKENDVLFGLLEDEFYNMQEDKLYSFEELCEKHNIICK